MRMSVRRRKSSARPRSKRGCTPAAKSRAWDTRSHFGSTATSAMKHTSCISSSRSDSGSRPSTRSSPSKRVRPRIALKRVVLPAPLGPMSPTMRPGSMLKFTASTARVARYFLLTPRASITAVMLASRCAGPGRGGRGRATLQELLCREAQPLNRGEHLGPFIREKPLALVLHQRLARPGAHEHTQATSLLDQLLLYELLVAFQHRQRVEAELRRYAADRGQRVALFQGALEDHRYHPVPQLPIDR